MYVKKIYTKASGLICSILTQHLILYIQKKLHRFACTCKQISKYLYNECTEVQNPRYKDVTLNAYTSA